MKNFDIIVVGGGHAGIEAAWIASQFNLKVAIITMPSVSLCSAPCNPAIGGIGKGQVVREIDALGGLMGKLADLSGIQYRVLNESKGYAVRSTRVQIDKDLYSKNAEKLIEKTKIDVIRKKVTFIEKKNNLFLVSCEKEYFQSKKILITSGTFLNGRIHTGSENISGGRVNAEASLGIESLFKNIEKMPNKFKTGTPPRLKKKTLDFSKMRVQHSDTKANNFHFDHDKNKRFLSQKECYLTKTNKSTLEVIRDNKELSPMFNGQIKAIGARYCPSIEDKTYRYPERSSHHVFIEPEGLESESYYPSGISSSLPREVQEKFIKTIEGLERAEILNYGYAVEYEVVNTSLLDETLEYRGISGLYFAGQVNGTSGYEEAAGQGWVAGVNAALSLLKKEKIILDRNESYIGVMIEDLVTSLRDEPYRLFTSRSENRLYIREDNAIERMHKYRSRLGIDHFVDRFQKKFLFEKKILENWVKSVSFYLNKKNKEKFYRNSYGSLTQSTLLSDLLKRPFLDPVEVLERELLSSGLNFNQQVVMTVAISVKYEGYIKRASAENQRIEKFGKKLISWEKICSSKNISNECKERIKKIQPKTFSQLQKIDGIRPATLAFVAGDILL